MRRVGVALLCGLVVLGCRSEAENWPQASLPLAQLGLQAPLGEETVWLTVEVADEEHERALGLMGRRELGPQAGMIFVWPEVAQRNFWMKNTPLPLDMIFSHRGQVVGVVPWAKPYDETALGVNSPSDMVLEVPGGWAAQHGVGAGWQMKLSMPRE
jgi:uncharacterized protein